MMKYIRRIFMVLVLSCLLLTNASGEFGEFTVPTGFSTEIPSQEEIDRVLEYTNLFLLEEEPPKRVFEAFAVNDNGDFAVGYKNSEVETVKTVCIYSSDGSFRYGYRFVCYGALDVEFDKGNLLIYDSRTDAQLTVTPQGEIINVLDIPLSRENSAYRDHVLNATRKKVGDTEYSIRNDIGFFNAFAWGHSQVVVTYENGEEKILYDVTPEQSRNTIKTFILQTLVFITVPSMFVWAMVKLKRQLFPKKKNDGTTPPPNTLK